MTAAAAAVPGYEVTTWQAILHDARARAGSTLAAAEREVCAQRDGADGPDTLGVVDAFGREVFARLYDDPPAADEQGDRPTWAGQAHAALDALPEWDALRASTNGDPDLAAHAAARVLRAVAPEIGRLADAEREAAERAAKGGLPGLPGIGDAIRAALRRAVRGAAGAVDDARELLEGLAPGLGTRPDAQDQEDATRLALIERVGSDPSVLRVLRLAGRVRRLAAERRKVRDEHARQEVVDVERGADLARALPAGLARLRAGGPMRLLALRDIVERSLPQYRLDGKETLGRGPIVVLVDVSGSMQGQPADWARALAVATIGQAARERRRVTVAFFTERIEAAIRVDVDGTAYEVDRADARRLGRKLGGIAQASIACIRQGVGGGTDFTGPLQYALDAGITEDRADLVFVTDGQADADADTMAALHDAKSRGLRVFGLTVNGGSVARSIAAICDEVVDLDRPGDPGAAIARGMHR